MFSRAPSEWCQPVAPLPRGTHAASSGLSRAGAARQGPPAVPRRGRHVVLSRYRLPGKDDYRVAGGGSEVLRLGALRPRKATKAATSPRKSEMSPWKGCAIALSVLGRNLFGDAVRDALDPRLRT